MDPREITAFTVVIDGCLATGRISLMCLPAVTEQQTFLLAIVAKQRYYTLYYRRRRVLVLTIQDNVVS
jgi:hypothetical protein